MSIADHFSSSYDEARARFRAAARAAGARLESFENPAGLGPQGEPLVTEVASLGPEQARRVYLTISGTHGAEGYCGSGIQVAHLAEGLFDVLPAGIRVVLVHAINPYGFAWGRRVNEDNVDLNRNFVDFDAPLPENADYARLHPWLLPADWDGPARAAADRAIEAYVAEHGFAAFQAAVTGGQYRHRDGLFYGGAAPSWSRRTIEAVIARHCGPGLERLAVIDYHTGLGPTGHGEPIATTDPGSPSYQRCRSWFGPELTHPANGDSATAPVVGTLLEAFEALPVEVATLVMEYGTVPIGPLIDALRGDHWLHLHGGPAHPLAAQLKARMRAAFYVETRAWKAAVFGRAADFTQRALRALAD